jgi:hypothetical protein
VLYHLSHTSSPLCSCYFWDGVLKSICPGWSQIAFFLSSAFQITMWAARTWLCLTFFVFQQKAPTGCKTTQIWNKSINSNLSWMRIWLSLGSCPLSRTIKFALNITLITPKVVFTVYRQWHYEIISLINAYQPFLGRITARFFPIE